MMYIKLKSSRTPTIICERLVYGSGIVIVCLCPRLQDPPCPQEGDNPLLHGMRPICTMNRPPLAILVYESGCCGQYPV